MCRKPEELPFRGPNHNDGGRFSLYRGRQVPLKGLPWLGYLLLLALAWTGYRER